ncbi:dynein-related subfamily AAA family protein [Micromonospora sp. A202]|uniref:AAA family ATPase n=1 Tax=Micromonospora sp. A202 TaxID=2572899 RepID=UPI0011758C52|nr:AAA family ATPase [Micromonospora sp. A202]TQJ23762.1 dynein-related subfamily AAA family protein [Micromonospora sp. A202]
MTSPARPAKPKAKPRPMFGPVLALLAAEPHRAFSIGDLGRELPGRSSGAIGSVLNRLVDRRWATMSTGSPRRYTITAEGIDAFTAGAGTSRAPSAAPGTPTATAAPAPAPTGPVPPRPGAVPRPNGVWYLPRQLGDSTDVEVLRQLRRDTIPVLLYGPPGTGKTSLIEAAYPDAITVAGHGDTTVEDLVGNYVPLPDGGFAFAYGPLVSAMRAGRALFIDDATLIPPRVLAALYPAMDGRAIMTIAAHHNEVVTATDGFFVCAGHNPGVHGAILTEALASRFSVHIEVTTDFQLARSLGVPNGAIDAAITLNTRLRKHDIDWAPQLRELLAFKRVTESLGLAAAVANLAAIAPEADRQAVIEALQRAYRGTTITPLTLGKQK